MRIAAPSRIVALALACSGLAGCGGEDSGERPPTEPGADGVVDVRVAPGGEPAFVADQIAVASGAVSFLLDNPSASEHDLVIEDASGTELGRTEPLAEGTTALTVTVAPGEYAFYCSVDGHRAAGMEGTLTVE